MMTEMDAQHKLLMSIISASVPILQKENATVTSGGQEDGATMREPCGVSAQMASMSQVSCFCVFWPP